MAGGAPRPVVVTAVVSALVTVVVVAAAFALRVERERAEAGPLGALFGGADADAAALCGADPCGVLTSLPAGPATVELLADAEGDHGRVRVGEGGSDTVIETALAAMGVRLTQRSLVCVAAPTRACLIRGAHDGGVVGEVFVARESWQPADRPYFSSAGLLELTDVIGDASAEVVVAVEDCEGRADECSGAPVYLEVFALDGRSLGCGPRVAALRKLPGWPDVRLDAAALAPCS